MAIDERWQSGGICKTVSREPNRQITHNTQSQRLIFVIFVFCFSSFSMRFYFDFSWVIFDVMFADFFAFTACCTATILRYFYHSVARLGPKTNSNLRKWFSHFEQWTKQMKNEAPKPNVIEIRWHALTSNRWKMEQKSSVRSRADCSPASKCARVTNRLDEADCFCSRTSRPSISDPKCCENHKRTQFA